ATLTLDMGVGEEGQADLRVYYQGDVLGIGAALLPSVEFLDAAQNVLAAAPAPLLQLVLGDTQATYAYPAAPSPYRYVRLRSGLLSLLCVDAIEALAAAGPTATAAPSSTLANTATHAASATPLLSASPNSTSLPGPSATPSATLSSILLSASAAPLNTATPAPRQPTLTPA